MVGNAVVGIVTWLIIVVVVGIVQSMVLPRSKKENWKEFVEFSDQHITFSLSRRGT